MFLLQFILKTVIKLTKIEIILKTVIKLTKINGFANMP